MMAVTETLILLVILRTSSIDAYGVRGWGYRLARLGEKHMKEEKVISILQTRLLVLKQLKSNQITRRLKSVHKPTSFFKKRSDFIVLRDLLENWEGKSPFKLVAEELFINRSIADVPVPKKNRGVTSNDLSSSFYNWAYLQGILLMRAKSLVFGLTVDTSRGGNLSSLQSMEIAMFQVSEGSYSTSIEWMETAIALAKEETVNYARIRYASSDLLKALYSVLVQEHNIAGYLTWLGVPYGRMQRLDVFGEALGSPVLYKDYHRRLWLREFIYEQEKNEEDFSSEDAHFQNLCRRHKYGSLPKVLPFKCYLDRKRNPYFLINPLQVEQFSENPPIYRYYNVVGNRTIQHLSNLRTETVYDNAPDCGLKEGGGYSDPIAKKHFLVSEMMTGLHFSAFPAHCYVSESTPGRFFIPHNDHGGNLTEDEKIRDRETLWGHIIATVLYYFEEPAFGGGTAFLSPNLVITPVRGSALFWFNTFRNGQLRWDVAHGGCPVIHGEKIGQVHFFRYNVNWHQYKCSTHKHL